MKTSIVTTVLSVALMAGIPLLAQEKINPPTTTEKNMKQIVIDQITVPANAKEEFVERMNINRNILKKISGFIKDEVFEREGENGNLVFITVATWRNQEVLEKAKAIVGAEYQRTGFNVVEFCKKHGIIMQRGIYHLTEY